jgi:hypothetical protein
VLPEGQVSFTWTKVCGADGPDDYYSGMGDFKDRDRYGDNYGYGYDYYQYGGGDAGDWSTFEEVHWNPDTYAPDEDFEGGTSLGHINIGRGGEETNDVVDSGWTQDGYRMVNDGEDQQMNKRTIVPRDVDAVTFYLSVPDAGQSFTAPHVSALKSRKNTDICTPTLSGEAQAGGQLTAGAAPLALTVNFNCQATGVTAVVVAVPMDPPRLGSASFRVTKICGTFQARKDWSLTAGGAFGLMVGVGVLCVCLLAYCVKKMASTIRYQKVSTQITDDISGGDVQLDDFGLEEQ